MSRGWQPLVVMAKANAFSQMVPHFGLVARMMHAVTARRVVLFDGDDVLEPAWGYPVVLV